MRIAVVGAGYWGQKHIQEYDDMGFDVSVVDTDPERRKYCKRKFDTRTQSFAEMLSDPAIKYVSMCTPNTLHYELGSRVVCEGKHLLVEEPMCKTSAEANQLHRLARKAKTKLLCGHLFRFNNAVERARQSILTGQLGDIMQVKCYWHQRLDFARDRNILLDIGLHPVDIVHYWFGHVPRTATCIPHAFTSTYAQSAFLDYVVRHGGSRINVEVDLNWLSSLRRRDVIVFGTEKTMALAAVDQALTLYDERGRARKIRLKKNNALRDQLSYFLTEKARIIEEGEKANGRIAVEVMRTLERIDGTKLTGGRA